MPTMEENNFRIQIDDAPDAIEIERRPPVKLHDGSVYSGSWSVKHDQLHGYGEMKYADGSVYTGFWKNGFPHGKGIKNFSDGCKYEGNW